MGLCLRAKACFETPVAALAQRGQSFSGIPCPGACMASIYGNFVDHPIGTCRA